MIGVWMSHVSARGEEGDLYEPYNAEKVIERVTSFLPRGTVALSLKPLGSDGGVFSLDEDVRNAQRFQDRTRRHLQSIKALRGAGLDPWVYWGALDPEASPQTFRMSAEETAAVFAALSEGASTIIFDRFARWYDEDRVGPEAIVYADEVIERLQQSGFRVGGEGHESSEFQARKDLVHMPMEDAYTHNINRYRDDFSKLRGTLIRGGEPYRDVMRVPHGHLALVYPYTLDRIPSLRAA